MITAPALCIRCGHAWSNVVGLTLLLSCPVCLTRTAGYVFIGALRALEIGYGVKV